MMMEMQKIWVWRKGQKVIVGLWVAAPYGGFTYPGIYLAIGGRQRRLVPLWGKGYRL